MQKSLNRNKAKFIQLFLLVALCDWFAPASLHASELTPAMFKTGKQSLDAKIKMPKSMPDGRHLFFCEGYASRYGHLRLGACHGTDMPEDVESMGRRAIARSVRRIRITPATVDGLKENVWFNFSVLFRKDTEQQRVRVLHNHLLNVTTLGLDYVAPQRILKPSNLRFPVECGTRILMLTEALVDVTGKALAAEVVDSKESESLFCTSKTVALLLNSNYIPAILDGEAHQATYKEVFFSY